MLLAIKALITLVGTDLMQPEFETERLLLRPRTMVDFQDCIEMDRDPEVTRFIPGPWNDPAKHEIFLTERIEHDFGGGLGYWSIFPKARPDHFVGWILLIPEDGAESEVEIGWRLNRAAWGNGYAPEAADLIVNHAFRTLALNRIVADIAPGNTSSMRVAAKIGMKPDAELSSVNSSYYVMTRADFNLYQERR